ncbi:MAG: threonylcarbamoyl-AMP synthase [Chloroflexi bacterium]|nr:threonylcarbamoyl-AMP synthase [Chloroflexota bacterium]
MERRAHRCGVEPEAQPGARRPRLLRRSPRLDRPCDSRVRLACGPQRHIIKRACQQRSLSAASRLIALVAIPEQTHVISVDSVQPDFAAIHVAAELLRAGQLVAFPTETVYGLGANAHDSAAVGCIFSAKSRPANDPIIVHIAALGQIDAVAREIPDLAYQLAQHFWPGPLTLVLARHPNIPPNVSAGLPTVAVRMPVHPVARALIQAADCPIAAPSANTFSRPSATTAQHVLQDLGGRVAVILDAGPTPIGLESTVLDLTGEPVVLRPGGVDLEQLRVFIPNLQIKPRYIATDADPANAPGQLTRHYAPSAQVLLFSGPVGPVRAQMQQTAHDRIASGQRVGVLVIDEERELFVALPGVQVVTLGPGDDLAQVGARLFAALRALDRQGVDVIVVRALARAGLGAAIWDRLLRAADGKFIAVEG